jgi:hypothetical protein
MGTDLGSQRQQKRVLMRMDWNAGAIAIKLLNLQLKHVSIVHGWPPETAAIHVACITTAVSILEIDATKMASTPSVSMDYQSLC